MPEAEATALFKGVYDAGCRHFDTAEVYRSFKTIGEAPTDETVYNESQLGVFFKTVPRVSFTVASKFMPVGKPDCTYETVKKTLQASLARLGLDFVDLYYSHRVLSREQGIEFAIACRRLKEEGLLRNVGLSEVSAADLRAVHAVTPICCIQQEWSLLTREPEEELVPVCKELNIGIVAYSPLARNLLAAPKERPTDQRRSVIPRFDEINFEKNQEMVAKLEALAVGKAVSPAQLSMGWLLQKGRDLGIQLLPIPGTKTLSHALENIASTKIELAPEDMVLLEEIAVLSAGARESDAYMEKGLEGNTKRSKESGLPVTMGAIICREGGATPYAPASFEYEEAWPCPALGDLHRTFRDLPGPVDAEVLVQVAYSSMNPADRGADAHRTPKVMGSDLSGTVIAVSPGCTKLKVGDQVWGDIGANATWPSLTGDLVKTKELGAWAEYAVGLESQLGLMPKNISMKEAGALPKVALTSYKALVWHCDAPWTGRDEAPTVLVLGGSSGCGTCGIQLAWEFGAGEVITTCSARNVDYCTETLKASQVIDYTVNSWWETLGPNSVDVVFDCIGEAGCADHALQVLRTGGSFVSIMFQKSETTREDVKCGAFVNSDTNLDNLEQLDALKAIVEAGKLRMPRIDHSFALAQIDDALAQSASKRTVGKAVLECSGEPIYEDEDGDATLVRVNTDNEVRRTYSSGTTRPAFSTASYDKMLADPSLSEKQRASIQAMKDKRIAKEQAKLEATKAVQPTAEEGTPPKPQTVGESLEETIEKFTVQYRKSHAGALAEIQSGQKSSCWSWWVWPTNYRSGASGMSRIYALSDEQAAAFMQDAYLRGCWLQMMNAVAEQVESGVTMQDLCGIDVPRVSATCKLMKRVVGANDEEVAAVCTRVTAAIDQDATRPAELVRRNTLVGTTKAGNMGNDEDATDEDEDTTRSDELVRKVADLPEPEPVGSDELVRGSTLVGTTTAGNMGDDEDMIED